VKSDVGGNEKSNPSVTDVASVVAHSATAKNDASNPLCFVTRHPEKPAIVDLTEFATGRTEGATVKWKGGFSGRPELIHELFPAFQDLYWLSPSTSCSRLLTSLRRWWRLFDEMEERANKASQAHRVESVSQLTELHGQAARDANFGSNPLGDLRRAVNLTRRALGLREVTWRGNDDSRRGRRLPDSAVFSRLWHAFKRHWFSAIDRWARAQNIVSQPPPPAGSHSDREEQNFRRYAVARDIAIRHGRFYPSASDIRGNLTDLQFSRRGLKLQVAYSGFFPNSHDIRVAFHLCLAGSGWNPQTILDLPVDHSAEGLERTPFLKNHPQSGERYILRGFKERGASEPAIHGDWRTDRSPGVILRTVVERTWPLRQELVRRLSVVARSLECEIKSGSSEKVLNDLTLDVAKLRRWTKSPWLFCNAAGEIGCLEAGNYAQLVRPGKPTQFLRALIDEVNLAGATSKKQALPYIVAGDFRDAFAGFVWGITGGSVLHVMKALQHRRIQTTLTYLDNTRINEASTRLYLRLGNGVWKEIRETRSVDATILAKTVQDGGASVEERSRLNEYRTLKRSRLNIGCKDPLHPPPRVAGEFVPNARTSCPTHRCLLCQENAVLLPESLDGIGMRVSELEWLRSNMSIEAFLEGSFQTELDNGRAALLTFPPNKVEESTRIWAARIASGEHRVLEFHGARRPAVKA